MSNLTVQKHHLAYLDSNKKEWLVKIYRHEHYYITRVNRISKNVSQGFLDALELYILKHRKSAINLEEESEPCQNPEPKEGTSKELVLTQRITRRKKK